MPKKIFYLFVISLACGCSPGYVLRGAYEQGKILLHREDIDDALQDPDVTPENKVKLQFVVAARTYAKAIGLEPKQSFTKYAPLDRDVLSWVVMGCKKDSFTPYSWWFPIVGTIPYKGYFEKEDAVEESKGLEDEGYETWVRGTDAFSTLGWFNDPILTTTLRNPVTSVVNTVIHEIVHTTFWFKGSVEFNESLANFIGTTGAAEFFKERLAQCGADTQCTARLTPLRDGAAINKGRALEIASMLSTLYDALNALYTSDKTRDEKINERQVIFDSAIQPLRAKYPNMTSFSALNNAEIMQLKIYLTHFQDFERLYTKSRSLPDFIEVVRSIFKSYNEDGSQDPFAMLSRDA